MSINRDLSLIEQQRNADRVRENQRIRAEGEAKKLLHRSKNITSYTPMGVLPSGLQQQLQDRASGLAERQKPKTPEERAKSLDVKNAVANLRANKGIEAPEFAGETEFLPSADDVLAGIAPPEEEVPLAEAKSKTPQERAKSLDVKNAVANLRANKGIEAPKKAPK